MGSKVKYPQLADRGWLEDQYSRQGKSTLRIAAEVGCSPATVQLRLQQFGIGRRSRAATGRWRAKPCQQCGGEFQPKAPAQRFCDDCWLEVQRTCGRCGKEFVLQVNGVRAKHRRHHSRRYCDSCVAELRGEPKTRQAQESGGTMSRRITKYGYVEVNLGYQPAQVGVPQVGPNGTIVVPNVDDGGYIYLGRVLEHRWVMEQVLGRKLRDDEIVHHKNGNRQDNRPENLEVWLLATNHKGIRPEDLLAHALDVLLRYDPGAAHELLARYGFIPSGEVIELPVLEG